MPKTITINKDDRITKTIKVSDFILLGFNKAPDIHNITGNIL